MRDFINNNKWYVGGALAVIAALLIYINFFSGGSSSDVLSSSEEDSSPISQNLLLTLSNLHIIKLNEGIFSDSVFVSLSDFGVVIPLGNVGRRNPFAPPGSN